MKKTIICCVICIIITVAITNHLNSSHLDEEPIPVIAEADRHLDPPFGAGPLVSIVWYKGTSRNPYKLISNSRQIDDIHYRLQYKGNKEGISAIQKPVSSDTKNLLAFVYNRPKEDSYRMRYIRFEIKDNIFYWKYGQDKKVAQILQESEIWNRDLHEPSRVIDERSAKEKKAKEKYSIENKRKIINQIKKTLPDKDAISDHDKDILNTCKLAKRNILEIVGFATSQEVIDEVISELETNDLKESTIHAFAQVPKWMLDKKNIINPKHIRAIEQLSQRYDNNGLNRDEQRKLFKIHQIINKQILAELLRKQEDFEKILKTNESNQKLIE